MHKLYWLTKFAEWQRSVDHTGLQKGYVDRFLLYAKIIEQERLDAICYLEFGVSKGVSMKWWLSKLKNENALFFGFDTFEGIPEDWGTKPKGSYTNYGNIPEVDDSRCTFIKGLFQDTLTEFVRSQPLNQRLVVHLDADLYTSTLYCLFQLAPHLKAGDLIIFDELDITTHEFRAWADFQSVFNIPYQVIGESDGYNKCVLKVI